MNDDLAALSLSRLLQRDVLRDSELTGDLRFHCAVFIREIFDKILIVFYFD